MAQTNFTPILTYKSDTAAAVPSAGNLINSANGAELAVNTADKRLFTKDSGGSVVELGTNPSSVTLPNGTANGVVYANGSKVLTTGSALTFDGTNLGLQSATNAYAGSRNGATFRANSGNGFEFILQSTNATAGTSTGFATAVTGNDIYFVNRLDGFYSWITGAAGNSEQMRLTSTGLGIGTSSPAYKLDVNGAANLGANVYHRIGGTPFVATSGGFTYYYGNTNGVAWRNAADNTTQMALDSSGNLGLGVTPSAWGQSGTLQAIQIKNTAFAGSGTNAYWGSNWFGGGFDKYITSAAASLAVQTGGQHIWYTAPSGTAGNAISFTQALTLEASGNLLLGTTSNTQSARLNVQGGYIFLKETGGGDVYLRSAYNGTDPAIQVVSNNPLLFLTSNNERMRIDSSGNLLVGVTTGSANRFAKNASGAQVLEVLNSSTTSGSRALEIGLSTNADAAGTFIRCGDAGAFRFYVLGNGNALNSNGSYGTISDAKLKENIVDATPKLEKLNQVRVVNYNLIGDTQKQIGVIAQELEQVFPGMVEESPDRDKDGNDLGTTTKSVKTSVFIPMLIKAMQEQQAIIESLKARLDAANL